MAKVAIVLIDGFEEIEALTVVDVLRRGSVDVQTVSLTKQQQVVGKHQIPVIADTMFAPLDLAELDMLIIPGGTTAFNEHEGLKAALAKFAEENKWIAAICAAPMVLGGLGLLQGKQATCYPGFEQYLIGASIQNGAAVVQDGRIITGRGPGLAMAFALQLLSVLVGEERRHEVAKGLLLDA